MSIFPRSVPPKTLAVSIASDATSFQLNDILDWDGTTLITADFGTQAFGSFMNTARTKVEFFEWDPSTIGNSSITITKRGLGYEGSQTANEVTAHDWTANDTIVNLGASFPQLLKQLVEQTTSETIDGPKTFTSVPLTTGGNPTVANELARKAYVDSVVAGIATTVNLVVPGTAGETVAAGNLIYFDDTDNEWKKCDADTAATVENALLGIAQGAGVDGGSIASGVLLRGLDSNQSGLTAGAVYYASNTAGGISSSAGTKEVTVGFSYSTTQLYFNPRFNQQITEDEQDALGGTSGTPSVSNKFVTNDDVASAATANKIARRNSTGDVTVPSTPSAATDAASKGYVDSFIDPKVLVTAENAQNGSNVTRVLSGASTIVPMLRYADGATGTANFACRVPAGKTSISSINIIYWDASASALNIRLAFSICRMILGGGAALTDTEAAAQYASGGTASRLRSITVPASAYNGITAVAADDVIGFQIQREAGDGNDTYDAAWDVAGVLFSFT